MIIPILQFIISKGTGEVAIKKLLSFSQYNGIQQTQQLCLNPSLLITALHLSLEVAETVVNSYKCALELHNILCSHKVDLIWQGHPQYPLRLVNILGNDAPPYLFTRGNKELFRKKSVGFCGARASSQKGLCIASDCSKILVKNGFNIVSGYAKGVDLEAHSTALKNSGTTTIVLAEGILKFSKKNEVKDLLNDTNHLVVSQFPPSLSWLARNAMKRNHLIIGLSDAMVLIEAGTTGGTFAAGEATIKHNQPLYVVDYATPPESASGNELLVQKGGVLLKQTRQFEPNLNRLMDDAQEQFIINSTSKIGNDSLFDLRL